MKLSLAWAKATIPKGSNKVDVLYPDGDTDDIIRTIFYADERSAKFTENFSEALARLSKYEVARELWLFIKNNVQYVEDQFGEQHIKSPGQLVTDGKGDCKSFSVFIGSVLQNLGIPYKYRFTAYSGNADGKKKRVTHVYVVVPNGKEEIIIDAVYNRFNSEKRYTYKKDIMAKIAYVEGYGKRGIGCHQTDGVGQVIAVNNTEVKDILKGFFAGSVLTGMALFLSGRERVYSN
jgi:hypothetical protein